VAASGVASVYDMGAKWSTSSAANPVRCTNVSELVWTFELV